MKKILLIIGGFVLAGVAGWGLSQLYAQPGSGGEGDMRQVARSGLATTSGLYASTTSSSSTWNDVSSLKYISTAATSSLYVYTRGATGLDIRICSGATTSPPSIAYDLAFSEDTANNSPENKVYAVQTYAADGTTKAPARVGGSLSFATTTEALPCRNIRETVQNTTWTRVNLRAFSTCASCATGSLIWFELAPQL